MPTLPSAAAPARVMDALDARAREVVRAEAIDPQRDVALVRRIAENVAREHDDRSLTGAVAKLGDVPAVVAELLARMLKSSGRSLDFSSPFVDAMLPDFI